MNNNYKKQALKIVAIALVALAFSFQTKAQNKTTAIANLGVIKNADLTSPRADSTVKLVDNKGTIKYLQVKNGLTAITNKATDGTGITTTWQLGGSLTDSTFIDVNGKAFVLDGIKLVTTDSASINAVTASSHGTGTGWTVLIRDEATGATQKIKASDLLQVQAGQNVEAATATTYSFTIPTSKNRPNEYSKISVYRNGAKLVADTDYKYDSSTGVVSLDPAATTYGEWALYVGDVIEIQWVK